MSDTHQTQTAASQTPVESTTASSQALAQGTNTSQTPVQGAASTPLTTVSHINVPYGQTWNYLRINETSLKLPEPAAKGAVLARLPQIVRDVHAGVGSEAIDWIEKSAGDARYIEVPRNSVRPEPIVLSADALAGDVLDTGIMVREGATATIAVVSHGIAGSNVDATAGQLDSHAAAEHPAQGSHSANLVRIIAEKNATVHIVEIVALGSDTTHLEGIGISAADNATIDIRQYALGGDTVALGFECDLTGDNAHLQLDLRYIAQGNNLLDVNHLVRQRGCNTRCDMKASGILSDHAQKTLRETIDLVHGAKGSQGNEAETVLVTGDDVVNKTLPVILCDEDDVAGNHGASIGSISPEQLAYLMDRGVSEDEAVSLFLRAIFDDAAIHAPEAVSRAAALSCASASLGDFVANDLAEGLGLDLNS